MLLHLYLGHVKVSVIGFEAVTAMKVYTCEQILFQTGYVFLHCFGDSYLRVIKNNFLHWLLFKTREVLVVLQTTLYSVTVPYLSPFHTKAAAKQSFSRTTQE